MRPCDDQSDMRKQVWVGVRLERALTRLALTRGGSGMTWSDQPLEDAVGPRVRLDGELRWRSECAIRVDETANGFVVTDNEQRATVFVPLLAGRYRSQSQAWSITVERRRFGWRLVARPSGGSHVVASARPAVRPGAYTLRVAPDLKVLLARNMFSADQWQLRHRHQRIAQIGVSELLTLTGGSLHQSDGSKVGTLTLERSTVRRSQLELLVLLALATIRADASLLDIPGTVSG
jgi:hypothetical protein